MITHLALSTGLLAAAVLGWAPTGVKVIDGRASGPVAAVDGAGGVFISWLDERIVDINFGDVYGQHVLRSGALDPLWPATGAGIANEPDPLDEFREGVAPGLAGSAYWTWTQRISAGSDLMLKRTRADGSLDPSWPSGGVDLLASTMDPSESTMIADGSGGVFVAWREETPGAPNVSLRSMRCQRILADGSIASGWPVGGVAIRTVVGGPGTPELVLDGEGGVFLNYGDFEWATPDRRYQRVQHLLSDGTIAPGWPEGGVIACTFPSFQTSFAPAFISDGAGGVYVAWDDMRDRPPGSTSITGDIYMTRIGPDGTRPPGWPAEGRALHTAPGPQWAPRLCPDGSGGALAAWVDLTTGLARITRVRADGTLAPGWPVNGTVLCTAAGFPNNPVIVSDGQGGAYAGWLQEQGADRVYAQHFRGDGTLAPGWAITGTLLVDLPDAFAYSVSIVPGDPGTAIMVWLDGRLSSIPIGSIRAQKLVTDGLVPVQLALQSAEADAHSVRLAWWGADAPGESFFVERSADGESWERIGSARAEGTERLTFEDRDVRAGDHLAYRLVDASNRVVVRASWVEVPRVLEFALAGARPNPARLGALAVELSLAEQASGTLELLDLAGRRVAWRELDSLAPGRHTIPFLETASLAPGVHWLRLRQGLHERTARVVLTR